MLLPFVAIGLRLTQGFLTGRGDEVLAVAQFDAPLLEQVIARLGEHDVLGLLLDARATLIGFLDVVRPHAEPTSPSTPVIRQESMDTMPSLVNAAPRPALNSGASSMTRMAAQTASSAGAPCSSSA